MSRASGTFGFKPGVPGGTIRAMGRRLRPRLCRQLAHVRAVGEQMVLHCNRMGEIFSQLAKLEMILNCSSEERSAKLMGSISRIFR